MLTSITRTGDEIAKSIGVKILATYVVFQTLLKIYFAVVMELFSAPVDIWNTLTPKRRLFVIANPDIQITR